MEIRLGTIEEKFPEDNSSITLQDKITITEYKAIEKALKVINNYKSNKRLIEIVLLNNNEINYFFSEAFQNLLNKSVNWLSIKNDDMEEIYLHSNRLLLNYLTSIRTYIDHSSTFLTSNYGKKSKQLEKFQNLLSFNYDNNFCYRFFYKLRNYSQHCGVPIDNLTFKTEFDRATNQIHGQLNALFNPAKLLVNYDSWGTLVKADLHKMTGPFELSELRESMTSIMYNLNVNFNKINTPQTKKAAKYLFEKTKHLISENKQICLFYNIISKENGDVLNFSNTTIPIKEIEIFLKKKGSF